jgi:cytidylate kinase
VPGRPSTHPASPTGPTGPTGPAGPAGQAGPARSPGLTRLPGDDAPPGNPGDPSAGGSVAPTPAELVRVVALDGPAGSGKTTVAQRVAAVLGWRFVDTGATYRAVTLAVLRAEVDLDDSTAVASAAADARVELRTDPAASGVLLDGEDVSSQIRTAQVTAHVSAVSALPAVRQRLVELQRRAMGTAGAVVEGRDIATVVAPQAGVKVYLDARPDVRARRRAGEVTPEAEAVPGEVERAVAHALATRDALDHQTNKLEASDGALHLDTSDLSLDQVVDAVVRLVMGAGLVGE